jgi:hypothetical protein
VKRKHYCIDEAERTEIEQALRSLPKAHPAQQAFSAGEPIWIIARYVRDHPEVISKLTRAAVHRSERLIQEMNVYLRN